VIDAHHHLWDVAAREHRWLVGGQPWASDEELARLRRSFGLAELAPLAAASGVTGTVVVQTVAEPWETGPATCVRTTRLCWRLSGPSG
jgi:L-fuconolactonase